MLREDLTKERETLDKIIAKAQASLATAPHGALRISSSHGNLQYVLIEENRTDRLRSQGTYIKKDCANLIQQLAQKDYDKRVLKIAQSSKSTLEKFERQRVGDGVATVRAVYSQLSETRQALVTPYALTDEEYALRWCAEPFACLAHGQGDKPLTTDNGETVRSKSEFIIANKLHAAGIPYRYECRLCLGSRVVYPDFTILNVRTREILYWEHFGMMSDEQYVADMLEKLATYARDGIILGKQLIATFESADRPLDTKMVDAYISQLFT